MALKIVEAHVPPDLAKDAQAVLEELCSELWSEEGGRFGVVVSGVLGAERSGSALDALHDTIADRGGLLVLVRPLDAVLPRPLAARGPRRKTARSADAVSREEIYAAISGGAKVHRTYLALVVLASVVAGIGLAQDNTAAVIGAMVVAPLLGPNMALALGLVLGDGPLMRDALRATGVGFTLTLACATLLGVALGVDPTTPELASRGQVGLWDLVLAMAAGCAGALSYTTGAPTYLTGVMVAVALLPPTVASGMLASAGAFQAATAALLLAAGNITALTLASMLTFLGFGLRPRLWWKADRARESSRRGIAIFAGLLVLLAGLILASRRFLTP